MKSPKLPTVGPDVGIMVMPYIPLAYAIWGGDSRSSLDVGVGLVLAGVLFWVKQVVRYPSEFAQLVEAIVRNPYLNGENIRLDGALRFTAN